MARVVKREKRIKDRDRQLVKSQWTEDEVGLHEGALRCIKTYRGASRCVEMQ